MIANSPRTSITWPKFISDDTTLVMESFEVNAAMDTAMSRLPRIFGESATSRLDRAGLLRVFPRGLRQRHGAGRRFQRLGVGSGAVANAPGDALRDAGEAEQVVGEIPVQIGHGAAGDAAIDLRGLFQARNVERLEIGV